MTLVEGDWKATERLPFLIATTQVCLEERYTFPWIVPLTLDPFLIIRCVKQVDIKYIFELLV